MVSKHRVAISLSAAKPFPPVQEHSKYTNPRGPFCAFLHGPGFGSWPVVCIVFMIKRRALRLLTSHCFHSRPPGARELGDERLLVSVLFTWERSQARGREEKQPSSRRQMPLARRPRDHLFPPRVNNSDVHVNWLYLPIPKFPFLPQIPSSTLLRRPLSMERGSPA